MARLVTCGYEFADIAAVASGGNASGDFVRLGASSGINNPTIVTSPVHSGVRALKCDAGASNLPSYVGHVIGAGVPSSTTLYVRVYLCFANLPGSTIPVFATTTTASSALLVRVTSAGKVQLFDAVAGAQVGSDSAATISADGATWYRFELGIGLNASFQPTSVELRLDGVTVASGTPNLLAVVSTFVVGWFTAPGANNVLYADDFVANSSTGSAPTSWPGDGSVVLLVPVSLNANGGSWVDDKNQSTGAALTAAVDNTPPQGIADTTSNATGGHQIRNGAANTTIDFNLTDYTTAGVTGTVNVLTPLVNVAAPVSTGGKSGSFGVLSNPTIAQRAFAGGSGTATFFWRGTAAGTYPSGWGWEVGTVTPAPSVTLGTSPVARLSITGGTTSRVAMSDFLGMYVDYTPAAGGSTYTKAGHAVESA